MRRQTTWCSVLAPVWIRNRIWLAIWWVGKGNGGGLKSANAVKGGEGAEKKKEEEEEEEEWKPADANAERWVLYNKNKWILVAEWYDVDEQEARNRAAEIMIEDFNNRGGQVSMLRQEKGRLDHTVLEMWVIGVFIFYLYIW